MLAPILYLNDEDGVDFSIMYMARTPEELQRNEAYFKQSGKVKYSQGILTSTEFQSNGQLAPPGFPKQVWYTMNKDFLDAIIREVSSKHYDIIKIEHSQLSWVVPRLRMITKSKVVLDCHNLEYLIFERWLSYAKPEHEAWLEDDYKLLKKWEEDVFNWFDDIYCISPVEKEIVEGIAKSTNVHYVPTGAGVDDNDYIPKDKKRDKPLDLFFVGSMNWFPTTDALTWLIEDVMPLVWREMPGVKLDIVGSDTPDAVLRQLMKSNQNITFWGAMENEVPFLHQSKIFVSPIRIGAGVRLKNPTAWVAHLPIVATSLSVEGLEYSSGHDLLIGDTPEEFAGNILKLLKNPELQDTIAENGYKSYVKSYSTEKIMEAWKRAFYSTVRDGK